MSLRQRLGLGILIGAVALLGLWLWLPGWTESAQPATVVTDQAAQLRRGEYLTRAGNCLACHTALGGQAYAGGRTLRTDFGTFVAPNITPHPEYGLGQWTADDFWRALHYGRGKDGRWLYPAFPYPQYTQVTREDADAMFAHLRTIPPVAQPNQPHQLRFPYDQRALLRLWQALYFKPAVFQADPTQSVRWNRGAYLVQGLGHCGACHTARGPFGGPDGPSLGGGLISGSGWYAPALGGAGDAADLAALLQHGVSQRHAAYGPMAEVVSASLQYLDPTDIRAMADYLQTLPQPAAAEIERVRLSEADQHNLRGMGQRLYKQHCADCHGSRGQGFPPHYPPLSGNRSLTAMPAGNAVRIVLHGGFPPGTAGNPRPYGMPPFRGVLKDHEVAAVVSYIRTAWENQGGLVTTVGINRHRAVPED